MQEEQHNSTEQSVSHTIFGFDLFGPSPGSLRNMRPEAHGPYSSSVMNIRLHRAKEWLSRRK